MGIVGLVIPHSLRRSAWASRATAAQVGRFALLTVLVYVADEHPAARACVEALKAGVMGLYGVVIVAGLRYSVGVQCGTRSHERSGLQWTRDSVRSRRHPARAGSVTTCAKPPEKSKGSPNRAGKPDQVKVGRVNESESSTTRRKSNRSSKCPG